MQQYMLRPNKQAIQRWLTEWASKARDIYWNNLYITFMSLIIRRLIIVVTFFFLKFFYIIPITFV
jgi:calcium permeable stress-gated cation channel